MILCDNRTSSDKYSDKISHLIFLSQKQPNRKLYPLKWDPTTLVKDWVKLIPCIKVGFFAKDLSIGINLIHMYSQEILEVQTKIEKVSIQDLLLRIFQGSLSNQSQIKVSNEICNFQSTTN